MKQNQQLIDELKRLDSEGVEFAYAKETLIAKGYTETEIALALYQFNYDGVPDTGPHYKAQAHLNKKPHVAEQVGDALIKEDNRIKSEERRNAFILNSVASRFAPGRHAQSHYLFKALGSIEFPYFTVMILSFVWMIFASAKLGLSENLVYAGIILIVTLGFLKAKFHF